MHTGARTAVGEAYCSSRTFTATYSRGQAAPYGRRPDTLDFEFISRVSGMAFEITDAELAAADRYEQLAAYKRITATLASGKQTWVYVDARDA